MFESKERFLQTYCISSEPEALSAVDFDKSYVVGIHQGLCPTGGYRIHVQDVRVSKGIVEITVDFQEPAPDEIVTLSYDNPDGVLHSSPPGRRTQTAGIPLPYCRWNCTGRTGTQIRQTRGGVEDETDPHVEKRTYQDLSRS